MCSVECCWKISEKSLLHDHSILLLLSTILDQTSELDVSMIASAARNIMETTNIYFHISQRGIDTSALELRVETMVLNEIYNEIEITKKLGFSQNCEHSKINTWYFRSAPQRFQRKSLRNFVENLLNRKYIPIIAANWPNRRR